MHTIQQNKWFSRQVAQREPPKILLCRNKSIIILWYFQAYILQDLGSAGIPRQSPHFGQGRSSRWRRQSRTGRTRMRWWDTEGWWYPHTQPAPCWHQLAQQHFSLHRSQATGSLPFCDPPSHSLHFVAILQPQTSPVPVVPLGKSHAGWQQP